ncbi:MAG: hypothetical protein NZ749_14280, partial [bacterium]|nr:hypothetical protein [bacterium]
MVRAIGNMQVSLVLILLATIGEATNLLRSGGIATLLAGKAVYQSAVADMQLTFPTSSFALLAFAFLGIHYSSQSTWLRSSRNEGKHVGTLLFAVVATPLLLAHIIVGQRMELA